jgi:hypothetical protein
MATAGNRRPADAARQDEMILALTRALAAGASVTFTHSGAGSTVTVAYQGKTLTAHGTNTATALENALAALPTG